MQTGAAQVQSDGQASDERIRQFIDAWKTEFGEELSEAEASIRLAELVEFYCLVARPSPEAGDDQRGY